MVAQNRGSVVLFWVPTLKKAVPPPPRAEDPGLFLGPARVQGMYIMVLGLTKEVRMNDVTSSG